MFPNTRAFIAHYNVSTPTIGLVGSMSEIQYPPDWFERRVDTPLQTALDNVALDDAMRLFGCLLAGRDELARYAGSGPQNTDDHPIVIFGAPRLAYEDASPFGRLPPFIDHVPTDIDDLIANEDEGGRTEDFRQRLHDFIAARNVYLHGMINAAQNQQDEALNACIESARMSPDFTTGYAYALEIAGQIARDNPRQSRDILHQLIAAQPRTPDARDALRELFQE